MAAPKLIRREDADAAGVVHGNGIRKPRRKQARGKGYAADL